MAYMSQEHKAEIAKFVDAAAAAQPRSFGELLLGQAGRGAVLLQQGSECPWFLCRHHRGPGPVGAPASIATCRVAVTRLLAPASRRSALPV